MALKITGVWDNKARVYTHVYVYPHIYDAVRTFEAGCADKTSSFARFPGDYELHEVGEFDQFTGQVRAVDAYPLCRVTDFIPVKE